MHCTRLQRRQEELEKKAEELARKEEELKNAGAGAGRCCRGFIAKQFFTLNEMLNADDSVLSML